MEKQSGALPEPAQRLLDAALELLNEGGLAAVTTRAVARRANQPQSNIAYHFGDKAGLLAALFDAVNDDAEQAFQTRLEHLPPGRMRLGQVIDHAHHLSSDPRAFPVLIEIMGWSIHDDELRAKLAGLYVQYRRYSLRELDGDPDSPEGIELEPLAGLAVAVLDGLGIQHALDPDNPLLPRMWALWATMLDDALANYENTHGAS